MKNGLYWVGKTITPITDQPPFCQRQKKGETLRLDIFNEKVMVFACQGQKISSYKPLLNALQQIPRLKEVRLEVQNDHDKEIDDYKWDVDQINHTPDPDSVEDVADSLIEYFNQLSF